MDLSTHKLRPSCVVEVRIGDFYLSSVFHSLIQWFPKFWVPCHTLSSIVSRNLMLNALPTKSFWEALEAVSRSHLGPQHTLLASTNLERLLEPTGNHRCKLEVTYGHFWKAFWVIRL